MHIRFPKENLQKAITVLQKVSQNKTNSNTPGVIYITTKNDHVELQGNDFDLGIKLTVDATIIEEGTLVVASKYFQELVRKMPGTDIELIQEPFKETLMIQSGLSKFTLMTLPLEVFTLVEHINDDKQALIDSGAMKNLIDLTTYACATDEDRPIFTGALLEINAKDVIMVGTDTHRMAVKKITLEEAIPHELRAIIPNKTLTEVSRLLPSDNPAMVKISWNRTQIAFEFDTIYMISRLIEGTFPDYTKVIPATFDNNALIKRKELSGAVDRVSLLAKDFSYNVIRYDWENDKVTLSTKNTEIGMANEVIPCQMSGEPFTISFNGRYVSDILRHSTGEEIHLSMKHNGPMVIRQDNNSNYLYVVTPVRTNDHK